MVVVRLEKSEAVARGRTTTGTGGRRLVLEYHTSTAQFNARARRFSFSKCAHTYEGEIPQTDLFVPYNEIEENLTKLPKDKGGKIVLYCRSGSMSTIVARELVKLDFTNVSNLAGGMVEWEKQGYELIRKP